MRVGDYCAFDIIWKEFFGLAKNAKKKKKLSFSNIYTKINLRPKVGLAYAISIVN